MSDGIQKSGSAMKATIQHINNNPDKPLGLHINGELIPGQLGLDITSSPGDINTVVVRFVICARGVELVGIEQL